MSRVYSCLWLLVVLGLTAVAQAETISTDATWKATDAQPSTNWNVDVDYDDTSWVNPHAHNGYSIWCGSITYSGSQTVTNYFRKVFRIEGKPTSGSLYVRFDDYGEFFINGQRVLYDAEGAPNPVIGYTIPNIASYLRTGDNLLASVGKSDSPPNCYLEATLTYEASSVPEPSSFLSLVCGTFALAGFAAKRRVK